MMVAKAIDNQRLVKVKISTYGKNQCPTNYFKHQYLARFRAVIGAFTGIF